MEPLSVESRFPEDVVLQEGVDKRNSLQCLSEAHRMCQDGTSADVVNAEVLESLDEVVPNETEPLDLVLLEFLRQRLTDPHGRLPVDATIQLHTAKGINQVRLCRACRNHDKVFRRSITRARTNKIRRRLGALFPCALKEKAFAFVVDVSRLKK